MDRIIILNDELESQMRMYLALCDRYRVDIAEDEANLMRMIRRKKPGLVFIDAGYSGYHGNGKTICKSIEKIRRKYEALKVVAILNGDDPGKVERVREVGADGVLMRPINEEEVVQSANRFLSKFKAVTD